MANLYFQRRNGCWFLQMEVVGGLSWLEHYSSTCSFQEQLSPLVCSLLSSLKSSIVLHLLPLGFQHSATSCTAQLVRTTLSLNYFMKMYAIFYVYITTSVVYNNKICILLPKLDFLNNISTYTLFTTYIFLHHMIC